MIYLLWFCFRFIYFNPFNDLWSLPLQLAFFQHSVLKLQIQRECGTSLGIEVAKCQHTKPDYYPLLLGHLPDCQGISLFLSCVGLLGWESDGGLPAFFLLHRVSEVLCKLDFNFGNRIVCPQYDTQCIGVP